jgi:hypothetical protein
MREKRRTKRGIKRKVVDDMCRHYLTPPSFISERFYLFTRVYKQQKEKKHERFYTNRNRWKKYLQQQNEGRRITQITQGDKENHTDHARRERDTGKKENFTTIMLHTKK